MVLAGVPCPWLRELGPPSRLRAPLDPRQSAWGQSFSVGPGGRGAVSEVRGACSKSGALRTIWCRIHDLSAGTSFGRKTLPMKEAPETWVHRKRNPASKLTVTLN